MSDAELAALHVRIEFLQKGADAEAKAKKYIEHLLENMKEEVGELKISVARHEGEFAKQALEPDKGDDLWYGIDSRVRTVERLVWIAVGGLGVVGILITLVGHQIATALTKY